MEDDKKVTSDEEEAETTSDIISSEKRSQMMSAVGQKDTSPEMAVRAILTDLGCHYRVENRDLPGSPDVANRSRSWAVFVNGCFWHGHKNCPKTGTGTEFRVPKSNPEYWLEKFRKNRKRDARAVRALRRRGFTVVLVWECELRDPEAVRERLRRKIRETGD